MDFRSRRASRGPMAQVAFRVSVKARDALERVAMKNGWSLVLTIEEAIFDLAERELGEPRESGPDAAKDARLRLGS